jgi:serine/threonine protein kinase
MFIILNLNYYFQNNLFVHSHKLIDEGAFGYIYNISIENKDYIVKIFKEFNFNKFNQNELSFAEKCINMKHKCPNIVEYYSIGIIIEPSNLKIHKKKCIVMKCYTPLHNHLKVLKSKKIFNKNIVTDILIDVFNGCQWMLNNLNLVHSDLKIDNILVDLKTNNYIISDFGITAKYNKYYYCANKFNYSGNISMYPFYNCYYNKFVLYSIGVLLLNVMGISTDIITNMNKDDYNIIINNAFDIANINDIYLIKILNLLIEYNYFIPSYMNYYIDKYEKSH